MERRDAGRWRRDRQNEGRQTGGSAGEAKQAGEIRARWAWVEPSVWTERMLTALEQGVKGGKWFSLMDKVYARANLRAAFAASEGQRRGGGGGSPDGGDVRAPPGGEPGKTVAKRCGTAATGRKRSGGCGFPSRAVRRNGRWGFRRFETGWCKRRCGTCWNRSSSGTLPSTATAFGPDRGCKDALRRVDQLAEGRATPGSWMPT